LDNSSPHDLTPAAKPAADTFALRRRFAPRAIPRLVVLPVAFGEMPSAAVVLTPEQVAEVDRIQEQFLNDIGGEPADPGSSDYLQKWSHAQPLADQRLRAAIGAQAFARWQEEAYLRSRQSASAEAGQ
jgi:hypothetical protein